MFEFKLPDLGEGIHEGEILTWHVKPGQTIAEDDPLVEVETDKAAVTIPSPKGGKVSSINGKVGDVINVGDVVAVIDDGTGEAVEEPKPAEEPKPEEKPEEKPAPSPAEEKPKTEPRGEPAVTRERPATGPVPAAPATRRLARELGVNINQVPPTGPAGRVTDEDVRAFAESKEAPEKAEPKPAAAEAKFAAHAASAIPFLDIEPLPDFSEWGTVEKEPLRSIRRKVARKMVTSLVLVPHVAHMDEADVTALEDFRKQEKERREKTNGGKLTLLAFVVKAVTAGLRAAPRFNASLDPFNEEIIYKKYYNIGIAVDSGHGLIVPVIKNTDQKSIMEIANDINDLAKRGREGSLDVSEMRGGTFTITNIGVFGGTGMLPAINYPEVAILGMGGVQEKPVVRDGKIVIRRMLPLTMSFDHRVADGADAARFVSELVRHLSDPNLLLLET